MFTDFSTSEVSVVLSTVAGSATEARTGRLDTVDRRLRWRNRVDDLAGEDLRPEKVGRESVERETTRSEDEDGFEPWWWEMARARRACERVRDEVEAIAHRETVEREREREVVLESPSCWLYVRERERVRLRSFLVYTSGK